MARGRHRRAAGRPPLIGRVVVTLLVLVAVGVAPGAAPVREPISPTTDRIPAGDPGPPRGPSPVSVPPAGSGPAPVLPPGSSTVAPATPAVRPTPATPAPSVRAVRPAAFRAELPAPGPAPAPGPTPAPEPAAVPTPPAVPPATPGEVATAADERASIAIATGLAQVGVPYLWGGDGPESGEAGFDCSGLTRFAYAAAGVPLPRTSHLQYYAGPGVPAGAPLRPGDLVFYGVPERVHHVGLYLGDGRMVTAPGPGQPVRTSYYRWRGDDYLGATRPAADPGDPGLLPPQLPAPPPDLRIAVPEVVAAPRAPVPLSLPRPDDPQPPEPVSAAAAMAAARGE